MVRIRKPRILVVDDDPDIRYLVESLLAAGYTVEGVAGGQSALTAAEREEPDLVVLDLMMPGIDGFEVCRRLRLWSQVPILVLSARDRAADKVRALDLGADDYVTKPFNGDEFVARVRAILRRPRRSDHAIVPVLVTGDLRIDFDRQQVLTGGHEVKLTPTEFQLLRALASQPEKLMTHAVLLQRVWGPAYRNEVEYLRVFVRRLRRKIEPNPEQPRYIVTEARAGYRFHLPD